MKVIFLDWDGVIRPLHQDFSKEACNLISSMLIKDPTLRIVVSSSWRVYGLQACRNILANLGIDPTKVIDITRGMPEHSIDTRDHHIKQWLREHLDVKNFVIFDDEMDMFDFKHKYVKPDPKIGITKKDVEKAMNILENKSKY